MVLGAARAVEHDSDDLTVPSFRSVLLHGLPAFLREGFLPLAAFYVGWKASGLVVGIGASAAVSLLIYVYERRAGRDALMVRLSLAFVVVQSAVGLLSDSATVYLATPVIANAAWAVAFLASAAVRRPLAGALACAWYPFPPEIRSTDVFKHVFGVESVAWGLYLAARSALRLGILLTGHIDVFVAVVFVTGTPAMLALVAWSIRYSIRRFAAVAS
jgi:hypothetical protein